MTAQVSNIQFERHAVGGDPAWEETQSLLRVSDEKYHVYFKAIERVLLHVSLEIDFPTNPAGSLADEARRIILLTTF